MSFSNAIRCFVVAATGGFALASAGLYAAPSGGVALYPMCAFGTAILAPFPGDTDKRPQEDKGACHARLNDRLRLVKIVAKLR